MVVVSKISVLLSPFSGHPDKPIRGRVHVLRNNILIYSTSAILILALSFYGRRSVAQQPSIITQHMFTSMAVNPAYAGGNGGINLTGLVRQQWMGWKDHDGLKSAPQTFMVMADAPIRLIHGGIGGSVVQDQIGAFKNTMIKLGYAYRTEQWSGNLSFGLQGSLLNISYDGSKFKPIDEGDPVLGQVEKATDMLLDLGLGAYYQVPEEYYIGISAENLLQTAGKKTNYRLRRTFYLNGGYQWTVPDHPEFELQPSAQVLYDGAVIQFNASALLEYNKKFYGGLGYRYQDAVSVLAGLYIKGLHIGLAYDISTSAMSRYNNGSLEVLLNYCFKIDVDKYRRTYRNTRFL